MPAPAARVHSSGQASSEKPVRPAGAQTHRGSILEHPSPASAAPIGNVPSTARTRPPASAGNSGGISHVLHAVLTLVNELDEEGLRIVKYQVEQKLSHRTPY